MTSPAFPHNTHIMEVRRQYCSSVNKIIVQRRMFDLLLQDYVVKISEKDMARQRQGIFAFFLRISRLLPGPDLELWRAKDVRTLHRDLTKNDMLTRESQEPVHRLMPSLLTPRQLTRFSWPLREPTLSPRRTSHTLHEVSQLSVSSPGSFWILTYLALKIVITSEKQSSRDGESNGSDATQYLVALRNLG